jgi:hypothetical protein
MFALLDLALADEAIACWDAKYTYNFWRPITAIRAADQGNPNTEADPNWNPLMPGGANAHPSYPSAHSSVMGTCAEVLARYFGTDDIPFSLSWFSLPGVTRSYTSFSQAAEECAMSRVWLGIHYSFDVTTGLDLGRSVGAYVFQNFLLPRGGAAPRDAGPSHGATQGLTAVNLLGEALHTLGRSGQSSGTATDLGISSAITGPASVGQPVVQQSVYPSSEGAASTSAGFATRVLVVSHGHGWSVDDVVDSANSWGERSASIPESTASA